MSFSVEGFEGRYFFPDVIADDLPVWNFSSFPGPGQYHFFRCFVPGRMVPVVVAGAQVVRRR